MGISIAIFGMLFLLVGAMGNLLPLSTAGMTGFVLASTISLYYLGTTHKTMYYLLMTVTILVVLVVCFSAGYGLIYGLVHGWF